jgi:hypothetical protein
MEDVRSDIQVILGYFRNMTKNELADMSSAERKEMADMCRDEERISAEAKAAEG